MDTMTRKEIIRALECCAHAEPMCELCPLKEQLILYGTGQGIRCHSRLADELLPILKEAKP